VTSQLSLQISCPGILWALWIWCAVNLPRLLPKLIHLTCTTLTLLGTLFTKMTWLAAGKNTSLLVDLCYFDSSLIPIEWPATEVSRVAFSCCKWRGMPSSFPRASFSALTLLIPRSAAWRAASRWPLRHCLCFNAGLPQVLIQLDSTLMRTPHHQAVELVQEIGRRTANITGDTR